ncbi:AAA family ATPase [Nocardia transvalensis]|uniref:AAA family ATPase n=1 Tax=Nocardia transvalensis TaxID=37333 RepID=UPI001895B65C|nr:AAA family ATPase [Nocardia transvalensis]MBF6333508.1 AAA family ATPase [Nocardia transvalensis]
MRIRSPRPVTPPPGSAPEHAQQTPAPAADDDAPDSSAEVDWPGSQLLDDPVLARVLFHVWNGDPGVVVASPPGAGKTRLVILLALALAHRAGLRVGIAAQTRAQALEIAARLSGRTDRAVLMWKKDLPAPGSGTLPVVPSRDVHWPGRAGGIIVGVTDRWLYGDPYRLGADVMIVDEAWQCTFAHLGALGALATQIVCVGDPGQIAPVVNAPTDRWAGSPTAPNLPAPQALMAAHPDAIGVVQLEHTWRLGPATTALVQPIFYPQLPFGSRRPPEQLVTCAGTALPELARRPVAASGGPTDPRLIDHCADRARELLTTTLVTDHTRRPLTAEDLAVVVPHVSQASAVEAALADVPGVLVGTANALQGLERSAVVVLHSLAGYRDPTPFGMDPGRACVMLSRHRAHATVVYDTTTPDAVTHAEPGRDQALNHRLITALSTLPAA